MRFIVLFVIFGLSLFCVIPQSFSQDTEDTGFVILPGDVLHINVWKEETMDKEVLVLPDGTITFPLVGTVDVLKKTPQDLQDILSDKLQSYIPEAVVTVSVKAPLGHTVSIIGQVQKPGEIILDNRVGVMEALSQVGGLTPYADEGDIIIIRTNSDGDKTRIEYPYKAIARGKQLDKDIDLIPGDVIVVPTAGLF